MFKRFYDDLAKYLKPQKVLVIYGSRQVGKTTLLNQFLAKTDLKYKLDSGENVKTQNILSSQDFDKILDYIEGYELLVVDEAQHVPNIGMGLKIIIDQVPGIRIIATGSSSFELADTIGEPLTGRKRTLILFPISQLEFLDKYNRFELKEQLESFLVYGTYPEVATAKNKAEKAEVLEEIVNSYLLKDILSLEKVKGSAVILNLLKLLAFQIGSEVSLNELAAQLKLDVKTVARYLDLLEKSFVIISVNGFSRNLRSEIASKAKYYFIDTGIRNAVITQFNNLEDRNDVGQLWENFIFIERLKKRSYRKVLGRVYFWRTYSRQEIDIVEERQGKLFGFECKWSGQKTPSAPKDWLLAYPQASYQVINPKNYLEFVT